MKSKLIIKAYIVLTAFIVYIGTGFKWALALIGEPDPGDDSPTKLKNPLKFDSIPDLLAQLLDLVVMVAVPIAILFLIYAGFLFVSARGSEEKLTKAKSVLLYTVVGIALIVGAALLANVIQGTVDQLQGTASLVIIHHS
jgi:hypothetical protein